jgi:hypothetical protein
MRDVDRIIQLVKDICPALEVKQLRVLHPGADDDGLWYFDQPASKFQVQIESPEGMCPFLVETDENDDRLTWSLNRGNCRNPHPAATHRGVASVGPSARNTRSLAR